MRNMILLEVDISEPVSRQVSVGLGLHDHHGGRQELLLAATETGGWWWIERAREATL